MKTERRLYTAGRANGETSRCVDTFPGKAGGGLVGRALAIAALAVAAWCAHGDVWQDCTAWYMGGTDKDNDGVFENGELTDIRHAANPDSPTHGGGVRTGNPGASNRVETVVSATSGRTFPNQRVIYLSQIPGTTSNGNPGVREEDIKLPFAATTNQYTMLLRFRMDESQPTTKTFVSVLDCGYKGGESTKQGFYVRYYPESEQFGFLCNNGAKSINFDSPTNDTCRTLRETWVEMAVSMDRGTMRMGVKAPGMESFVWGSGSFSFAEGRDIPYNNKIYVGCCQGYGGISSGTFPVRGSVQMMAYWERVLSDAEVEEAFGTEGFLESAFHNPSVLTVGGGYGADVFSGETTGTVTEVCADLQDLAAFPAGIEAGRTLRIPFKVPDTCTNLPQQVRISTTADSAGGTFALKIDGVPLKPMSVVPEGRASRHAPAELFTEGLHMLDLVRTDNGANPVKLSQIEISGSWRLGWVNGADSELGGDITTNAGTKEYYVTELSSNRWKTVRSGISQARLVKLYANVDGQDAAQRQFVFKTRPHGYPAQSYDLVMFVNGIERFRRPCLKNDSINRPKPVVVKLPPGTLLAGENEFMLKTEIGESDPEPTATWMRLDYFALEVGKDPVGFNFIIR